MTVPPPPPPPPPPSGGLPSPDDPAAVDAYTSVGHRVLGTTMPVLEVDLQPGQETERHAVFGNPSSAISHDDVQPLKPCLHLSSSIPFKPNLPTDVFYGVVSGVGR